MADTAVHQQASLIRRPASQKKMAYTPLRHRERHAKEAAATSAYLLSVFLDTTNIFL
jgi:hypothetical protein